VEVLVQMAACLDATCRQAHGFWGIEDAGMLAGYWPDREGAECLELARSLQDEIRSRTGCTATAGVAVYPTLDYPQPQILGNARKAVDHAAFFGPNSRVAFDAVA
jgi:hypothetical protein